jgi:hypothetical protein
VLGGLPFFLVLLNFSRDLNRTTFESGFYSGVYDLQARAILDGNLWLPEGSMGIEGFVVDGRTFMYFPPFPAVLRLPILMTTREFDGELTVLSMTLAWVLFAAAVVKLIWLLVPRVTGTRRVSGATACLVSLFIAGATGGTFLTYDASLPWVYHEVYLWAVAAATGGLYWLIRAQMEPTTHAARWLGVCALAAIGTRVTEGWALCMGAIAVGVLLRVRRPRDDRSAAWLWVVMAGVVPLTFSVLVNLYKFDHVFMFPLQDQVWTQVSEQRRLALEANGGSLTGAQFFTTSLMAYLGPEGIRFVEHFPWITLPAEPARAYHGAFPDQTYRTGSVTSFMPLFLSLAIISAVAVFRPGARPELRVLRIPMVVGVLITGGVMAYGYYATRYSSEFVPALVLGGAVGTCLVARWTERTPRAALPLVGAVGLLTLFSVVAQVAIGTTAAAYHSRGEDLRRFLGWQHIVTPAAQAQLVTRTESLPSGGVTDELAIRGDCDGLYLNTGDRYEPWISVETRDAAVRIRERGALRPGRLVLFEVRGTGEQIAVEVTPQRELRFVLVGADGEHGAPPFSLAPGGSVLLGIRNQTEHNQYSIVASPGGQVGYLRSAYFTSEWISKPADLVPRHDAREAASIGLEVDHVDGLALPLCTRLAERAGIDLDEG